MSIRHTVKVKHVTWQERRIATVIAKRLRKRGIDVLFINTVDVHGARLTLWDLQIKDVYIAVRRVGHVLSPTDLATFNSQPGAYMQCGANDLEALLDHVGKYRSIDNAVHWAIADKQ